MRHEESLKGIFLCHSWNLPRSNQLAPLKHHRQQLEKKKVRSKALDGCSACAAGALRGVLRNLNLPGRLPRLPVTSAEQMAQFLVGFLPWPPGRSRHSPPKCRTLWCHAWVHRMTTGCRADKNWRSAVPDRGCCWNRPDGSTGPFYVKVWSVQSCI